MIAWILVFWLDSNDPYFPDLQPGYVNKEYATKDECLKAGAGLNTDEAMHHVSLYYCVEGHLPSGKESKP